MGSDQLLRNMLTIGENTNAAAAAQEANGYEAAGDMVEEVKN